MLHGIPHRPASGPASFSRHRFYLLQPERSVMRAKQLRPFHANGLWLFRSRNVLFCPNLRNWFCAPNLASMKMELDGRSFQVHEQFAVWSLTFEQTAHAQVAFAQDRNSTAHAQPFAVEKNSAPHRGCFASRAIPRPSATGIGMSHRPLSRVARIFPTRICR